MAGTNAEIRKVLVKNLNQRTVDDMMLLKARLEATKMIQNEFKLLHPNQLVDLAKSLELKRVEQDEIIFEVSFFHFILIHFNFDRLGMMFPSYLYY